MCNRRINLSHEYMTVEEKKKALKSVKENRRLLKLEIVEYIDGYPEIVKKIIEETLLRWEFEIDELTSDINNNIGPIRFK